MCNDVHQHGHTAAEAVHISKNAIATHLALIVVILLIATTIVEIVGVVVRRCFLNV
jgi:hypothetical protein